MCFYFFDIVDSEGECIDDEGSEHSDFASARAQAIDGIRSILSASVREGAFSLDGYVRVRTADGATVSTVPFAEAVVLR